MSRLRDNQALRDEVQGILEKVKYKGGWVDLGIDATFAAFDRALMAIGPGSVAVADAVKLLDADPKYCSSCGFSVTSSGWCIVSCPGERRRRDVRVLLAAAQADHRAAPEPETYPCSDCGELRTRAEGGHIFTVCDACWDIAAAENTIPRAAPQTDHRAAPACSVVRYDGKPCGCGGVGSVRHVPRGTQPREPGCQCHQEIGDSPLPCSRRRRGRERGCPASSPRGATHRQPRARPGQPRSDRRGERPMTYAREMAKYTVDEALGRYDDIVDAIESTIIAIVERCAVEAENGCASTTGGHECKSTRLAARIRALAAPPAGVGAEATTCDPPADGIDLDSCGGCGESCIVWRGDRKLYANDPCAWLVEDDPRIGKNWVFDCKNQDPREDPPAPAGTGARR